MNLKLETIVVPVSDVDRAKKFYMEALGFRQDVDHSATTYEQALGYRYRGASSIHWLRPGGSNFPRPPAGSCIQCGQHSTARGGGARPQKIPTRRRNP